MSKNKMQKKNLSTLLIVLLSLTIFSCANIPNVPICKELSIDRGYCSWTLSEGGFIVDDQHPFNFDQNNPDKFYTWWEYRPLMMSLPPHSWSELKKYLIKQCRNRRCRNGVGQWMNKFEKGGLDVKSNDEWNEPEFKEEVRDVLHRLTAPNEQSSGNSQNSDNRRLKKSY